MLHFITARQIALQCQAAHRTTQHCSVWSAKFVKKKKRKRCSALYHAPHCPLASLKCRVARVVNRSGCSTICHFDSVSCPVGTVLSAISTKSCTTIYFLKQCISVFYIYLYCSTNKMFIHPAVMGSGRLSPTGFLYLVVFPAVILRCLTGGTFIYFLTTRCHPDVGLSGDTCDRFLILPLEKCFWKIFLEF